MPGQLSSRLRALKTEAYALYLASRDPRCPRLARGILIFVAAYALSPLDLIPDFIPFLGMLDDMIIVPIGIKLALGMIPNEVIADARARAKVETPQKTSGMVGVGIILLLRTLAIIGLALISLHFIKDHV